MALCVCELKQQGAAMGCMCSCLNKAIARRICDADVTRIKGLLCINFFISSACASVSLAGGATSVKRGVVPKVMAVFCISAPVVPAADKMSRGCLCCCWISFAKRIPSMVRQSVMVLRFVLAILV